MFAGEKATHRSPVDDLRQRLARLLEIHALAVRMLPAGVTAALHQGSDDERDRRNAGVNESRVSRVHKLALERMALVLHDNGIDSMHAFQNETLR